MIDRAVRRVMADGRVVPWMGTVWRLHGATWPPDDPGGALIVSGRWNRGRDLVPDPESFPVLYTSTGPGLADWELIRHARRSDPDEMWLRFVRVQRSRLAVELPGALDLRDPGLVGLGVADLTSDDYSLTQAIAAAAYTRGLSGLLAPSATGMARTTGDFNVIICYDRAGGRTSPPGRSGALLVPRAPATVAFIDSERPSFR